MGFVKEFKEFAMKGNVMDLAIGVIIGAAFGKIVDSIVNDLLMPIISRVLLHGISFTDKFVSLDGTHYATYDAAKKAGAAIFAWGNFIQVFINFLIIAFVLFMVVKGLNRLKKEAPAAPAEPSSTDKLLMEIRDELKK
jgi:large conductance mechanosensitive channel